MKLKSLQIDAFGPFTKAHYEFPHNPFGLYLFYGPNEAGKSSLQRAIMQLFYGIPHRSGDDFLHPRHKLRIQGILTDSHGVEHTFIRRKGSKNTLLDGDEKNVPDEALQDLLGQVPECQYHLLFGLNRRRLEQGGREMMAGGGALGQTLFQAGTGRAGLQKLLDQFESEAASLYKDRGEVYPLNRSLKALEEARKDTRSHQLSSDAWSQKQKALAEAREKVDKLRADRKKVEAQCRRLQRLHEAKPLFLEVEKLEGFIPEGLSLDLFAEVRSLQRRQAEWQACEKDWTQRQRRWQQKYHDLRQQEEAQELELDWDPLRIALSDVEGAKTLELDILQWKEERQGVEREAEEHLKGLRPWPGTWECLKNLSLPSPESFRALGAEWEQLTSESNELEARRKQWQKGEKDWQQRQRRLQAQGEVPNREVLSRSRETRDRLWSEIRREGLEEARNQLFETEIHRTDELSDLICLEADRVAAQGLLSRELEELQQTEKDLDRGQRDWTERMRAWQVQWEALWGFDDWTPLTPPEMRRWLEVAQWALRCGKQTRELQAKEAAATEKVGLLRRSLKGALDLLEIPVSQDLTLSVLLDLARKKLSDADDKAAENRQRYQTQRALEDQERELMAEKEVLDRDHQDLEKAIQNLPETDLEALWEQLKKLEEVSRLRARIQELSQGLDWSEMRVASLEADEGELSDLELQLETLDTGVEEASRAIGTLEAELQQMEAEAQCGRAADSAQDEAECAERVRQLTERYVTLCTARALLQRAVERYRARHEGPLLQAASEIFSQITCGKFVGLRSRFNERDQGVLVAVRAGGEELGVEEMSDGTAEQLFLALRVASIRLHVKQYQPLPVLLDDALLDSDQDRSEEILKVLNDLAKETQVLVFSHHRYLREMAEAAQLSELRVMPVVRGG